ncbi:hypothetical protein [Bacillus sp. FSL K6-0067]|uniref:hypothetical protein n=1 Tax=Bacillus sp. FSL K6-0067 TaxID=2921412 RepID=UPI00077B198B|nr:hypothetical protein [Bacillus cereus]KXY10990.1 hypothetical protein AT267_00905 [Bacillus cereus]
MIFEFPVDLYPSNNTNGKEVPNPPVEDLETISTGIKHFVENHLHSVKEFIPQTIEQATNTVTSIENMEVVVKAVNSVTSLL